MDAVIIRLVDLPCSVPGITIKDEQDDYNVYINSRLSEDARIKAFRHEVEHIKNGDFYSEVSVRIKENKKCSSQLE